MPNTFGENIFKIAREMGYTNQTHLAAFMDEERTHVSKILNGSSFPHFKLLKKFSQLGFSLNYCLTETGAKQIITQEVIDHIEERRRNLPEQFKQYEKFEIKTDLPTTNNTAPSKESVIEAVNKLDQEDIVDVIYWTFRNLRSKKAKEFFANMINVYIEASKS